MQKAPALSQIKTKQELVDQALREFVAHRKPLDLRALKGVEDIQADYDYKSLRAGKGES